MKIQILFVFLFSLAFAETQAITLENAIKLTIENSREIDEAALKIENARIDLDRAKDLHKAELSLKLFAAPIYETIGGPDHYRNDYSKWGVFSGGELNIVKPLFNWNIKKNYTAAAKSGLNVARARFMQNRNDILKRVIELFFQHQLAGKILELADSTRRKLKEIETALKKRGNSRELLKFKLKKILLEEKISEANLARMLTGKALAFYLNRTEIITEKQFQALAFLSDDLSFYMKISEKTNPDMKQLNAGLNAKREILAAEKKKKLPIFFAGAKGDFKYSNVKENHTNPWVYDAYNSVSAGVFLGMRLTFNPAKITANERKALLEKKELELKKTYAKRGTGLKVERAFHEFLHQKKVLELTWSSMKLAKRLFVKEGVRYNLKKDNSKDLALALLEKVLSTKNYYSSVVKCNIGYIGLLALCGYDLGLLAQNEQNGN